MGILAGGATSFTGAAACVGAQPTLERFETVGPFQKQTCPLPSRRLPNCSSNLFSRHRLACNRSSPLRSLWFLGNRSQQIRTLESQPGEWFWECKKRG